MRSRLSLAFAAALVVPVLLAGQSRGVPAPDAVFGFRPGADYKLATYDQAIEYLRTLAASSRHVRLVEAGKTTRGRAMYFALISTPENLARIERYRAIARRLAHPAGLTEEEARALAREGKAIVHIDGGLHSTEVAGGQHAPLLAYDLVSRAGEPATKALLDHVIVMLTSVGRDVGRDFSPARYVPYDSGSIDRSSFDSVPGAGFDTNPAAAAIVPMEGRVTGTGPVLSLDPAQNNTFRAINRAWREGATVEFAAGDAPGAGRYLVRGLTDAAQADLVRSLALVAERTSASGVEIRKPRIGIYDPWTGSMDAGWTRWVLEQYGFEFVILRPESLRAPLAHAVDVVVLAEGAVPQPPGAGRGRGGPPRPMRPEYAATVGDEELARFEEFIKDGGRVVCLGAASAFPIQRFKLPVRNAVSGLRPEEFFLRGSIVEVKTAAGNRVMAGMPERAAVFVDGSPVFETLDGFSGTVLARYQDSGSPLLSGYLIGETHLHGKAAALDVPLGAGRIVLLGFRPQWRGQSFGTFKVLFNALLHTQK